MRLFSPGRLSTLVLRLYPVWWRARYGDEAGAVVSDALDEGRSELRIAAGLTVGALRARVSGTGAPRAASVWLERTRASILVATVPWFAVIPLAVVAALGDSYNGRFEGGRTAVEATVTKVALVPERVMPLVVLVSMLVAAVGWGRLLGAIRHDSGPRRARRWLAAALPGLAAAVGVIGLLPGTQAQSCGSSTTHVHGHVVVHTVCGLSPTAALLAHLAAGLLIAGWIIGPMTLVWAVRRSTLPTPVLSSGARVGWVLAFATTALALASVVAGVAQGHQAAPVPGSSYVLAGSSIGHWWIPVSAALTGLAVVMWLGAWSARYSYRRAAAFSHVPIG